MLKPILILSLVGSLAGLAAVFVLHDVQAAPFAAASSAVVEPAVAPVAAPVAPAPAVVPQVDAQQMPPMSENPLATYLIDVMNDWPHARKEVPAVDNKDIAYSIVGATSDAKDAVLLAALGYFEGARYAQYVDSGQCNDAKWVRTPEGIRMTHWGACDGGHAYTIFQIHPIEQGPLKEKCSRDVITASRTNAAICALEIAHRSLARTKTLVDYTGEWRAEGHPKADERLAFAKHATAKHPYLYEKPFE